MSDRDALAARIREWQSELEWLDMHYMTLKEVLIETHCRIELLKKLIEEEKKSHES